MEPMDRDRSRTEADPTDGDRVARPPRAAGGLSPARQFAVLALITIGASTLVFGWALAYFVERGILDREWASTAALVKNAARVALRPTDFTRSADRDDAADRFEEFTRQVRMLPEVIRLVAYDAGGRPFWQDTERTLPGHGPNDSLRQALLGETAARLEPGRERVELYVPVSFPGEGRVAGVVEAYVDASRVLQSVRRARLVLWTLAVLAGGLLYGALYGIVWRASRTLRAQHAALVQRAQELTQANAELRRVQQQLVTAERFAAFGEITAAVAHGLGNPLAAIRARAQVALLDAPEGSVRDGLVHVVAETDRLTQRMRALLDLGRPVEQRRVPTALDAAVRHALDGVRARCVAQGVRLETDVPAELPKVRLDPGRFEEAFLCLVGNALDAMTAGGTLRVSAAEGTDDGASEGGPFELAIADTGPGMPRETLGRAFEPFFTTKPDGTGLGLALARKLLESGGARLRLESGPDGTRAVITLPREA
jgi:signal transduction histidine kinase